jgi:CDP-2,3-bis-(O-geranylgeranyl)-sn-glycerol synthase
MYIAKLVGEALKFIFPAYCANGAPVLIGGGLPIDLGRKLRDGKPVFGKNKTFRGFFAGLIVGTFVGLIESIVFNYPVLFGLVTTLGALVGDLTGAFLKRRLDIPPGGLLPVVDQLDFIVGALAFSLPSFPYMLSLELAATVLIITPPIHFLMNYAAYKLGFKKNPW